MNDPLGLSHYYKTVTHTFEIFGTTHNNRNLFVEVTLVMPIALWAHIGDSPDFTDEYSDNDIFGDLIDKELMKILRRPMFIRDIQISEKTK